MTVADPLTHVQVTIAGITYQLVARENEANIRQLAVRADDMIRKVHQANPQLTQNMATVLSLVNALDELRQAESLAESARDQRNTLERHLAETTAELSKKREQNWDLKKDLLKMQRLLADFEQHLDKIKQSDLQMAMDSNSDALENEAESEPDQVDGADGVPPTLQTYQQSRLEDYI